MFRSKVQTQDLTPVEFSMKKLIKKYGTHQIRAMIATRFDVEGIVKGCLSHKAKNDWFIQRTKAPATYPKIATMIAQYSRTFGEE